VFTNDKEKIDVQGSLDPVILFVAYQNCRLPSSAVENAIAKGGVTVLPKRHKKNKQMRTESHLIPLDFILAHQNCTPTSAGRMPDCAGGTG